LILCICAVASGETDVQRVARQFREYALHEATDRGERLLDDVELPKTAVAGVNKWLDSLAPGGSWPDIDYASEARSSWRPYDHLTRVLSLTVFARRADTSGEEASKALEGVHRALAFWMPRDFKCPNWWYNEIGTPKILGNIALLLDADLKTEEREYIANIVLPRAKIGAMTGQNRVWLAGNGVMRGALIDDAALVEKAAQVIHEEIRVSTDEGVQSDFSFHQHGPQQQFGNYGLAYAVELSRWATVLRGTKFAFPDDKLGIIRSYMLDGENWVIWRGAMDVSSCGRQLFPNSPRSKAASVAAVMRTMAVVDPGHEKAYLAFIERNRKNAVANNLVGDRFFWRSDYLVHRGPTWCATLKMSSPRVIGGETVNRENLSGLHLADGATFFYRDGHEYDEIFPVWDWRKIPGTICAQDDHPLTWSKTNRGETGDFVGAAASDSGACAAMDFRRGDLRARKAWLFVGDIVVCLGADVTSPGSAPSVTTINQSLLHGEVRVQELAATTSLHVNGKHSGADPATIEHDGLRYVLPVAQKWTVSALRRSGNWKDVFDTPSTPKADVASDLFTLTIDHGPAPNASSYAYYVLPSDQRHEQRVEILSNTPTIQAASIDGKWLGVVFWSPGKIGFKGHDIAVDQRCIITVDAQPDTLRVSLADPTQKLKSIRVTVDDNPRDVALPQGGDAGRTVPCR
jgi:chondroitin AC lyase